MKPFKRRSLFAQRLDRIAFVAYFLGAVVPLAALAFALARLPDGTRLAGGFLVVAIAVLSLGAFLALRRSTREALARIDTENERLGALVGAAWAMSAAETVSDVARRGAESSLQLVGSGRALLLAVGDGGVAGAVDAHGASAAEAEALAAALPPETLTVAMTEGRCVRAELGDGCCAALLPIAAADGEDLIVAVVVPSDALDEAATSALSTLAGLASIAGANADLRDAQRNFFSHVTELLATALDAHLGHHHGHGHRVARLANRLGRALDLDERALHRLHFAALLHDIGMLKVPREMHADDRARRAHPRIGYDLLRSIRLWESSAAIVLAHHERWDGRGYPDGVAAEDIPLEARILAVCDVFDAITNSTAVVGARSTGEALAELEAAAGSQLDPECVRVFLDLAEGGALGTEVDVTVPLAAAT